MQSAKCNNFALLTLHFALFLCTEGVIKGLILASTKSGSGKTTIAMGIMASLIRRGYSVAPFKVGPDFIDPGHHSRITGTISRNLDGWMLSQDYNLQCFGKNAQFANIAVVEGVMGLFDGYDGKSEAGSTAQIAKWLGIPVVLVVDAKSMARSVAAMVQGFERFDPGVSFAGVIFNYVGSKKHLEYLKESLSGNVKMPCLGGITYEMPVCIPERHLGLVTSYEHCLSDDTVESLAGMIEKQVDMDSLLSLLPDIDIRPDTIRKRTVRQCKIGVAMDEAFCFYYQDNLDLLEAFGAELLFFSPMRDSNLPDDIDGLYLGGGYPELFAKRLSGNHNLLTQIRKQSIAGMPIYAECGGFMYLCRDIRTKEGRRYPMAGCFPYTSSMFDRLKSLGYREITLMNDTILGKAGQLIRGHEFHYSDITHKQEDDAIEMVYAVSDRRGEDKTPEGYRRRRTLGSYIHLHFGSCPDTAAHIVSACREYKQERMAQ